MRWEELERSMTLYKATACVAASQLESDPSHIKYSPVTSLSDTQVLNIVDLLVSLL